MTSDTRPPSPTTPVPVRPGGFRLGRVLGVPVYLRYSWLLLAVVVVILYAGVVDRMLPQLSQSGQVRLRGRVRAVPAAVGASA